MCLLPASKTQTDKQQGHLVQQHGENKSIKMPKTADAHIKARHATSQTTVYRKKWIKIFQGVIYYNTITAEFRINSIGLLSFHYRIY